MFKGVILAGGQGTRLSPLTDITNKFLMPVYDKLMIEYSVYSLKEAGISDIAIVLGTKSAGETMDYLKSGEKYGVQFTYFYQDRPLGVPNALRQVKRWAGHDKIVVLCADNILYDKITPFLKYYRFELDNTGCLISVKRFKNKEELQRFAVLDFDKDGHVTELVEKPFTPPSDLAFCGIQIYDNQVWEIIDSLYLSPRGEYEITHVINEYIKIHEFGYSSLIDTWFDCGNKDALFEAQQYAYLKANAGDIK